MPCRATRRRRRRHGGRGRLRYRLTQEARDSLRRGGETDALAQQLDLVDQWAGLRPKSADGLPLLGPTSLDGLWLAGGQYRNGILFAPAVAKPCADLFWGRRDHPAFDPRRFRDDFALHPRLAADTHVAADWPLCRVLVMNDARYPWLVLVPLREGLTEIIV